MKKTQFVRHLGCVRTQSRSFAADVSYAPGSRELLFSAACAPLSSLHLHADFYVVNPKKNVTNSKKSSKNNTES